MSRFQAIGNYVYEKGERIGCTPEEAADALACKLNAYQMRIERLKAEVERLEHKVNYWRIEAETDNSRWLRCLENNERLRKAGDAMAVLIKYEPGVNTFDPIPQVVKKWNAAKEGKPNA